MSSISLIGSRSTYFLFKSKRLPSNVLPKNLNIKFKVFEEVKLLNI